MRILLFMLFLAVGSANLLWAGEAAVLFLDGARLERQLSASRGYLETPLPDDMIQNSLRVRPLGSCEVVRVEIAPAPSDRKRAGKLSTLAERKVVLSNRLGELRQKEDIFRAAAKSQSGRAPRKTKTNPDPLESVRQGTDFALSRLESVQSAIRKAERELASVESELTSIGARQDNGKQARVWLSRADCRARIAFLVTGMKWIPQYDFRLAGSEYAEVSLIPSIPPLAKSTSISVVPLTIAEAHGADAVPTPVTANREPIATFRFPLTGALFSAGPAPTLSFTFNNSSGRTLPAGDAFGYWRGEYLGKVSFESCPANGSRTLVFGR